MRITIRMYCLIILALTAVICISIGCGKSADTAAYSHDGGATWTEGGKLGGYRSGASYLPREGTEGWMALFVVLRPGAELGDDLRKRVAKEIRGRCSPRHVPDDLFVVAEIPRTLSGKVMEVPVKRILMGADPEKVISKGSMASPDSLAPFIKLAAEIAP